MARVNQHPLMHQLVVLSKGWATFLHPIPNPMLTQHCTIVNIFGMLTLDPFFLGVFFPNFDHNTLQFSHPNSLVMLLT
jgi:hypothetical protein